MNILGGANDIFRWALGAVAPMFARPVPPVGLAWFVHLLLVAGAGVGMYFAQLHGGITVNVGKGPAWFRPYWLPALFALAYALLWSAVRLWQLLSPNQPAADFPDIDDAWAEITAALEKAGIGIADTPIYLVFGSLPTGFDPLFRALPHGLAVTAGASTAPLQAFANRDGIYVAVPGASLLGYASGGGVVGVFESTGGGSVFKSVGVGQSVGVEQSVGASVGGSVGSVGGGGGPFQVIQQIIREAREQNRPLTDDEKRRVRELSGTGGGGGEPARAGGGGGKDGGGSVLQDPQVVDEAAARLGHVCGLIAAARWPLCPVNGALVAVPAGVTEKDDIAQQWGLVARQDLAVAGETLKLRFPMYVLVGGVEDLPGGQLFFQRFAADQGGKRLGKGFPFNPVIRPDDVPEKVEAAVGWVFGSLLPYWAYKLTRVDGTAAAADTRDNAGLVRFLAEVRKRGPHLARLVSRAVVTRGDEVPVFGGCYLSAVLPADPNDAKFAREFFKKVESSQGYVAWADEAFAEDAGYRRLTMLGHVALAVLAAGVLAFAGYVAYTKGWLR